MTVSLAYLCHFKATRNHFQTRYLDYRALAEGLRIQLFWDLAGVGGSVAEHYLRRQRGELGWIREAIRGVGLLATVARSAAPSRPPANPRGWGPAVRSRWVSAQREYYEGATLRNGQSARRIQHVSNAAMLVGLILSLSRFVPVATEGFLAGMILFVSVAGLLKYYSATMAFTEHMRQYDRMTRLFACAETYLNDLHSIEIDPPTAELLEGLGREALEEHGDWVLLHRARPLKVQQT